MGQQQLHPMGIGEILDVAIKLYRRNAWTLIRIVLVIVVPVTIVANLIQVSATPSNLNPQFGFSSFTCSLRQRRRIHPLAFNKVRKPISAPFF